MLPEAPSRPFPVTKQIAGSRGGREFFSIPPGTVRLHKHFGAARFLELNLSSCMTGGDQYWDAGTVLQIPACEFYAIHATGHPDVGKDHINIVARDENAQGLARIGSLNHLRAACGQMLADVLADESLILSDQYGEVSGSRGLSDALPTPVCLIGRQLLAATGTRSSAAGSVLAAVPTRQRREGCPTKLQ